MADDLFDLRDYREFVLRVFALHGERQRWTYSKAAKFCGVQPTYFSNVLKGRADFSEDQVFLLCEYLKLDAIASEFLQLCHRYQRSQQKRRRDLLLAQLSALAERARSRAQRLAAEPVTLSSSSNDLLFYLDPRHQLLWLALGLEPRLENLHKVGQALGISAANTEQLLELLQSTGRIRTEKDKFVKARVQSHLGADSPLVGIHQEALRRLSLERMRALGRDEFQSLSATFTASKKDRVAIQEIMSTAMENLRRLIQLSTHKDDSLFQVHIDTFSWFERDALKF